MAYSEPTEDMLKMEPDATRVQGILARAHLRFKSALVEAGYVPPLEDLSDLAEGSGKEEFRGEAAFVEGALALSYLTHARPGAGAKKAKDKKIADESLKQIRSRKIEFTALQRKGRTPLRAFG